MRALLAASIWAACALPAFSGGCASPNCTEAFWRPLRVPERCFVETYSLQQVVKAQAEEIARLKVQLEMAAGPPAPPPCKMKGRTRNAAGQCGIWK